MFSIVVKISIHLTINENSTSLIIIKNLIFFDCFTTFDCRISIKIIVTLLNFLFEISNINVVVLLTTLTKKRLNRLIQVFEKSFLFIRKTRKFKNTS